MKQNIEITNFGGIGESCAIDGSGCVSDAIEVRCGCGGQAGACACSGHHAAHEGAAHDGHTAAEVPVTDFAVAGMTCGHCVAAVKTELDAVEGVDAVDVELVADGISTVHVTASKPIDTEEVRIAIAEAGYRLVEA